MRYALALVIFAACGEEAREGSFVSSGPRAPVADEEPSPAIVSPHVRRMPDDGRNAIPLRRPNSMGGGGGRGDLEDWRPRHEPPPSEREVAEFRERLEREMGERPPEPDDDECDRYFAVLRATAEANARPGHEGPEVPDRPDLRESCRRFPEAYRQCLSPEYFREHADECQREMDEMAARGRRRREAAERDLEAMRAGRRPWPGEAQRNPNAPRPPPEEDDGEEG